MTPTSTAALRALLGDPHDRDNPFGYAAVVKGDEREEIHGSDLLATETEARREGAGFRLFGRKWLINNGTRARQRVVLARTDARGGPRGFSLFLVDAQELRAGTLVPLPKIRTLGIR